MDNMKDRLYPFWPNPDKLLGVSILNVKSYKLGIGALYGRNICNLALNLELVVPIRLKMVWFLANSFFVTFDFFLSILHYF